MKVIIAIAITLQASVALADCFQGTQCVPFNAVRDADATVVELQRRGTLCLDAAEALRARTSSRNACFRPLDSAGISLFNNANLVEYRSWDVQQSVSDNSAQEAYEREQQEYERGQQQYRRDLERHNAERAEWERQCAAYTAATGLSCQ